MIALFVLSPSALFQSIWQWQDQPAGATGSSHQEA